MSLYDSFEFVDAAPLCAAGHPVAVLQTKDLACVLQEYYVSGGVVYARPRSFGIAAHQRRRVPRIDTKRLVLVEERALERAALTAGASLYATCPACRPVLSYVDPPPYGEPVREHWCRVEYELLVVEGAVSALNPVVVETRDDVRQQLLANPTYSRDVLDDDERLAVRHFELLARDRDPGRG